MPMLKENLLKKFYEAFDHKSEAKVFFSPGRVNLIGEHTDYNGGHVFPCALTIGTYAVARKRTDHKLRFYSENFPSQNIIDSSIDELEEDSLASWINYPKGVLWTLQKNGYEITSGLDILYFGNIPNSSGLSSSASIEILTGFLCRDLFQFNYDMIELSKLCQYSENHYNKVNCGIMDQFSIAMGKKEQAIFLDTTTLQYTYTPVRLKDYKIIIMNTNKKRGLGDSKYNERRAECEEALNDLQEVIRIKNLCELTEDQFEKHKDVIKRKICEKRARHAVFENQRTIEAANALKNDEIHRFGQLMIDSHESLKNDYEVTGIELDTLVEEALKVEGTVGARMTGAGFGGCAISIVKNDAIERFINDVGNAYQNKIGYDADFYTVEIGGGPQLL